MSKKSKTGTRSSGGTEGKALLNEKEQKDKPLPLEIKNEADRMIHNGLSEAVMGFNPAGSQGTQLDQLDTLFKNNRWYLVSNMRQLLSQIYVEHGLIQTVVDIPVDDGLRGGITIKSKQLDEAQIDLLQTQIEEEDILGTYGEGRKWNRLFGGAGVVIMTDDDHESPLDINNIKEGGNLSYRAVDMWELYGDRVNVDDFNMLDDSQTEYFNFYGIRLHRSRVMLMKGIKAPSFIRPRLRGWGVSVVEAFVRSINQYLKSNNLTFEVLDEFKIDVFGIKGLTQTLLHPTGTERIQKRMQLLNQQKNFQNAVVMDAEDTYQQKELTFGGISEVQGGIRMQVASDLRMPLTKLFGISAAGFSSGEDDIENYNAMIESQIRNKSKYDLIKIVKMKSRQNFGMIPTDLKIEYKPLRMLSAEQEENVKNSKFTRVLSARSAGEISSKDFREACNRDNLLPIQLDTSDQALADQAEEQKAKKEITGETAPKQPESQLEAEEAPEAVS